jgi:hypothetical protein
MGSWKPPSALAGNALLVVGAAVLAWVVVPWAQLGAAVAVLPVRVLIGLGVGLGFVLAAAALRRHRAEEVGAAASFRPLAWWWMPAALVAVVVVVAVMIWWLIGQVAAIPASGERVTARIEAVRTGLTAGAGVGAAMALLLAFRRQQHQERVAANVDHDAVERRITELYIKAVEQLGSDKAAVRLGGLYALERLGQNHPDHRQTIVDVLCAYLRMPFPEQVDPADSPTAEAAPNPSGAASEQEAGAASIRLVPGQPDPVEERQVRLTAQRILATHLRGDRPHSGLPRSPRFWGDMRLDLTNATLIGIDFTACRMAAATFDGATFSGDARFDGATFRGDAGFDNAGFDGVAGFDKASFDGVAGFGGVTIWNDAGFREAIFRGDVRFDGAAFNAGSEAFQGARVSTGHAHAWPTGWSLRPESDGIATPVPVGLESDEDTH